MIIVLCDRELKKSIIFIQNNIHQIIYTNSKLNDQERYVLSSFDKVKA